MSRRAITHLKRVDPVLARVIERVGPYQPRAATSESHFDALARAIVYQQLSGKAAATIHARLRALFGGRPLRPDELLAATDEQLRSAGLSRQKTSYLRDLAAKVDTGAVPLNEIDSLSDDAVIERLIAVKG